MKSRAALPLLLLCVVASRGQGMESATERFAMATNQLRAVARGISERCLTDVSSLKDWEAKRGELRRELVEMLGVSGMKERTPMKAQITGRLEREEYHIEKLVFQSLPGLYVTGNFYVPRGKEGARLPTVLYLCGHAPHPAGAKMNYQDRAAWFAAHGYACLILDSLEFGEVPGLHHGLHDLNLWRWLSLGYTPAGVEVWNAMRAIDYLETRTEVDAKRIGVTGISGGGASTWFTAAVDERVSVAAPVCSTYTFGSQAEHWRAWGQCDCIYFHNSYGIDFPVVAALIAPRPLLLVSGRKDDDFPPDGYHEVFRRSKRIYDFYGAGNKVREFDDEVGHSDPPQFLREARQWIGNWLKHDSTIVALETNATSRETAEDLVCLKSAPTDAINDRVHDVFTRPVTPKAPKSRKEWERRREEIRSGLNDKVFRWFPKETIPFETHVSRNEGGWASRYGNYKEVSFQTERGARVRAQLITPKSSATNLPLVIYVKRAGDSIYFMDLDELLPLFGRANVLILNPRFTEGSISASELRDLQMTAAWSGRTVAGMQVWDLLRAVEWAVTEEKINLSEISLFGKGEMGIVGMYAALQDARVGKVILDSPPGSHWEAPALLNVLRVTDIAEAAGRFAPRKLVVVGRSPKSLDVTRRIYRMQKCSEQFRNAKSLASAVFAD